MINKNDEITGVVSKEVLLCGLENLIRSYRIRFVEQKGFQEYGRVGVVGVLNYFGERNLLDDYYRMVDSLGVKRVF